MHVFFDSLIDDLQRNQIKCGVKIYVFSLISILNYGHLSHDIKRRHDVNERK
jgi:hypothetical protein